MFKICKDVLQEAAETTSVKEALLTAGSVEAGVWLIGDVQRSISFDRMAANTSKPLTKTLAKESSKTTVTTLPKKTLLASQLPVVKGLDNTNGTPACS